MNCQNISIEKNSNLIFQVLGKVIQYIYYTLLINLTNFSSSYDFECPMQQILFISHLRLFLALGSVCKTNYIYIYIYILVLLYIYIYPCTPTHSRHQHTQALPGRVSVTPIHSSLTTVPRMGKLRDESVRDREGRDEFVQGIAWFHVIRLFSTSPKIFANPLVEHIWKPLAPLTTLSLFYFF